MYIYIYAHDRIHTHAYTSILWLILVLFHGKHTHQPSADPQSLGKRIGGMTLKPLES